MQHRLRGYDLVGISASERGGVSAAFDSIIENLDEINNARAIQEQLFPVEVLSLASYKAFGLSKPARDLGGDYFDYRIVDQNNLLVVIGDVSGHGIPAALVVSMAKAVVTDFARSPGGGPTSLLDRLDQALFEGVKKKRFMTLGLLWIDTRTHQAQYFNCGHPFPILARADGEVSYLSGKGTFLGRENRTPRAPRVPVTLVLHPGDRFIFYTDGLPEGLCVADDVNAYEVFLEYVKAGEKRAPIREACSNLLQRHPHFATGKPQPDDFTLAIVEREIALPPIRR